MSCLRLAVLLLLIGATAATAQTTSGSMSGSVVDESIQAVPGATITIVNEATGEERSTQSNEVGDFTFPALVAGPYTIRVSMDGFRPLEVRGRVVLANNRLAVGALRLGVGTLTETVSVTARGETVASTTTSHQAVMDLRQVTNLSIRGRDPISLLKILPGVQHAAERSGDVRRQLRDGGAESSRAVADRRSTSTASTAAMAAVAAANFSGATNLDAIAGSERPDEHLHRRVRLEGRRAGELHHQARRHPSTTARPTPTSGSPAFNATPYFNHVDNIPKPEYRYSTIGGNLGGPIPRIPRSTRTARSCSSSTRSTTRG